MYLCVKCTVSIFIDESIDANDLSLILFIYSIKFFFFIKNDTNQKKKDTFRKS